MRRRHVGERPGPRRRHAEKLRLGSLLDADRRRPPRANERRPISVGPASRRVGANARRRNARSRSLRGRVRRRLRCGRRERYNVDRGRLGRRHRGRPPRFDRAADDAESRAALADLDDRRGSRPLDAVSIDSLRDILGIETATAAGVSGALPSAEPLFAELRRESRLGVHIDEEQTALGMTSFSAPLLDGAESPAAAAIAISTRSSLASPKRRRTLSSATLRIADECVRRSRASD